MKMICLSLLFISLTAFANNPQIRFCRATGGIFQVLLVNSDQMGFCQYGSALIDAITILKATGYHQATLASKTLESSLEPNCISAGGVSVKAKDLEGLDFGLCAFSDGSMIEQATLRAGPQAPGNAQLIKALKIRF